MLGEPLDPNARFRERRRRARRRRRVRRAATAATLLAAAAAVALGASLISGEVTGSSKSSPERKPATPKQKKAAAPKLRPLPAEMRGVHVTMALASLPGKVGEYLSLTRNGLNTVELDVKDETGEVGFVPSAVPLARAIGAARPYYRPRHVAASVHRRGVYLIGRVVTFEDPVLSEQRPELAVRTTDGSRWLNNAGLGWSNPYDRRVWRYNVDVAAAAARVGFDEIQFDYVRFPSDGDVTRIVYPHRRSEPMGKTISAFLAYASRRLRPLGVRVSADVFGLAATHDLRIGQVPRRLSRYVDAVYPMVYPSHYRSGEFRFDDPGAVPGRTVSRSLRDFRRALRGRRARIVPWLQDFSLGRTNYTLTEVRAQIDASRRAHSGGFMLWNPLGQYTEEALAGQ
jgi:hypothetical protein